MAERPTKRRVPAPGSTTKGTGAAKAGSSGQIAAKAAKAAKPSGRSHTADPSTRRTTAPGSSTRYTPPDRDPHHRPSPIYVPIAMFALLGAGMLLIVANYINVFGDADNVRLIIGLGLILAGIMVATQYR